MLRFGRTMATLFRARTRIRSFSHFFMRSEPKNNYFNQISHVGLNRSLSTKAPFTLEVPQMGDSITEGDVQEILKSVGDGIAADEVIAVIETDKVNVDIRSPIHGVVTEIKAAEGDTVEVGAPFMIITPGEGADIPTPAPKVEKVEKVEIKEEVKAAPVTTTETKAAHRIPSIRFRHGDRKAIDAEFNFGVMPSVLGTTERVDFVPYTGIPERYKRKPFTEDCIQTIEMGGADPY
mmetsp:Transcript_17720/g.26539  ORF Transcript_17720/g.26539 Transcript_17720/m.26539 type:complete len:235 (+) Transcript_17720:76-780(+)